MRWIIETTLWRDLWYVKIQYAGFGKKKESNIGKFLSLSDAYTWCKHSAIKNGYTEDQIEIKLFENNK